MRCIILFVLLAVLLAGCGLFGTFHEVTFRVESPDLAMATVAWWYGTTESVDLFVALPYSTTIRLRHAEAGLRADIAERGTVTAMILVDGKPLVTDSVITAGPPVRVIVIGYVPE